MSKCVLRSWHIGKSETAIRTPTWPWSGLHHRKTIFLCKSDNLSSNFPQFHPFPSGFSQHNDTLNFRQLTWIAYCATPTSHAHCHVQYVQHVTVTFWGAVIVQKLVVLLYYVPRDRPHNFKILSAGTFYLLYMYKGCRHTTHLIMDRPAAVISDGWVNGY